jgi:hypothetical protein
MTDEYDFADPWFTSVIDRLERIEGMLEAVLERHRIADEATAAIEARRASDRERQKAWRERVDSVIRNVTAPDE